MRRRLREPKRRFGADSDSDDPPPRIPPRATRLTQTSFALTNDLQTWSSAFQEAVTILTAVVPYPPVYLKTSSEERSVLLDMCRRVVHIAANPENSPAFKALQDKLEQSEQELATLRETISRQNAENGCVPKHGRPRAEKSALDQGLDRLEAMLSEQVQETKRHLRPGRLRREDSRVSQIRRTASVIQNHFQLFGNPRAVFQIKAEAAEGE
jgi:hypothetical protein